CRKWLSYTLGILQWATIKLLFYDSTFWGTRQTEGFMQVIYKNSLFLE
ncbi:hypothetical protein M2140_002048, partial [Clostridiales Family XIII bacterium PM5-7]